MELVLGPSDRVLPDADGLLGSFLGNPTETGTAYLDHVPSSPPNRVVPEDLAVTLLMNSYASGRTFLSVATYAHEVDPLLAALPDTPLEESSPELRERVVDLVSAMASWPHVQVSVATKLLHKKRPGLIPVLDNRAIFGALLWSPWAPPERKSKADSVHGREAQRIAEAIDSIHRDLTRPENAETWEGLAKLVREGYGKDPTKVELFDMVWWRYFRECEPSLSRQGGRPSTA